MLSYDDLKRLNSWRKHRKPAFLIHCFDNDQSQVFSVDDYLAEFADNIAVATQKGQAFSFEINNQHYFITPYLPMPRIAIIGAVHISQYLAPMAQQCGFEITIIDPREGFASKIRFPDSTVVATWPSDYFKQFPLDDFDALIALTHNPDIDDLAIIHAMAKNAFYIGALGSRKTHAKRVERLLAQGIAQARIDKIHAPIGLNIHAVTPQEIAVAILAEIIQCWRMPCM